MKTTSEFKVHLKRSLTSEEFNILYLFYLPILGFNALGIYGIFYNLAKLKETNKHSWLFDSYGLKLKGFLNLRAKLEGLNLIETYQNDDNYLYLLKPPLTREEFLQKPFFGKMLESKIGDNLLKMTNSLINNNFSVNKNYKLINKTFEEAYEFTDIPVLNDELIDVLIYKKQISDEKIDNGLLLDDKNYNFFINKIGSLATPDLIKIEIKEEIIRQAKIYGYDINDFAEIIRKASIGKTKLEARNIKIAAKQYHEDKYKSSSKKNNKISLEDQLTAVKKISFKRIIDEYINDIEEREVAIRIIDEFWKKNEISDENLIKVLIINMLKKKDGKLPNANYLHKVYKTWEEEGINTALDALRYVTNFENNKKTTRKKKNIPDWHDKVLEKFSEWD